MIIDPGPGAIKFDGPARRTALRDRDLHAALARVRRDGATRQRRYVYDTDGFPLGIVTIEPTRFSPKTGKRMRG